jgi:phosphinothricin acetyltransferase
MTQTAIRPALETDAIAIARIYNHYIANTVITFETEAVTADDLAARVAETVGAGLPWLVAEDDGGLIGYAYASKWKGRCAYRYAVESTIYLDPAKTGNGAGSRLYTALIDAIRACSMHAVIGGISLPNEGSIRLHERLGFEKVGHFAEVGYKQDRWVDVGYWQLML